MAYSCKRQSNNGPIDFFATEPVIRRVIQCILSANISVFTNRILSYKNRQSVFPSKRVELLVFLLFTVFQTTFAQHSAKNNYTGAWERPASWNPTWSSPVTNINNNSITIQGYITANSSLSFSGSSNLTVKDTLVIKGNLTMNDNNDIKIEDHGIIIVWGNLTISYDTHIEENGYLVVAGNIVKVGDVNKGNFSNNDNPVKVFVGGLIPKGLTADNSNYKALNCTNPNTTPYPNSTCSYGNMADIINDPIYPFYQTTCVAITPTITAGGPTTFCYGGSVTLTSSTAATYSWSTGATTQSIVVSATGSYTVKVTDAGGCGSAPSTATPVTVNPVPVTPIITAGGPTSFCSGGSVILTSTAGTSYLWSNGATTQAINVTASGSYNVKTTNASGCQSAASTLTVVTVIALPAAPVVTAGGPTTFCAGGNVNLTSGTGTSYLWSTGATAQSINVTSAGSYTVKVTNSSGCQSTSSVATAVTVNTLPPAPAITAGGPQVFCAGGSVTLSSGAGITYLWSNGATSSNINVTESGNYSVRVTNASGCLSAISTATSVTVNPLPVTPTITAGGPTSFCSGGSVTLASSAATTYLWSNGATTQSINVSASGSYTVVTTNASGCLSTASTPIVVTVIAFPIIPVITANGPTDFCVGGSVNLTSGPGTTYLWSNGATTQSINVTSSGGYTVRVTNSSNCQSASSATTNVNVNALPVVDAGTDATIFFGTSTTLNATVSGSGPFTYSWSPSGKLVNALIEDPATVNLTSSTLYTLIATSSATSCFNTGSVIISIIGGALNAIPEASSSTICAGASVNLDALATGGTGTYFYTWTSVPAGFSSFIADPVVNPSVTTTYHVAIFDGVNTINKQVTVTVNPIPSTPTITAGGPTTFCAGGNVTLTSSAGTNYLWSNGATTQTINVTGADSYTVRVTNASGCQSAASTASIVTVVTLPVTPTITAAGPTSLCAGGSVTLTSSAGTTYLWSNGGTSSGIIATSSGSYTVTTTNASGCQSAVSTPIIVTVNALPAAPAITAGGPTTFCAGGNVTLSSSAGSTYLWSNGSTSSNVNIIASGSYAVRVTNADGCQSAASTPTVVSVNTLPFTPTITAVGPTTFCEGGNVTLTSSAGTTYLWSNGATTSGINITSSGSYSVMTTNASGCQSAPSTASIVTVNASPITPIITTSGPTTFCEGGSVTLTSSAGTTYLWSNGETAPVTDITGSGSYSVTVTNANGCQSSLSVATTVTVNPLPLTPTISAGGPTSFCEGESVKLSSSSGQIYLWSTGATTPDINVSVSGSYTVIVTNSNGCQSVASTAAVATVFPLPVTPTIIASGPTTFCEGGSVTLTSSAGTNYLWSTGATSQSIVITESGNYTVVVTNASGCLSAESVPTIVTVNVLPSVPTIVAGSATTFCDGGNVNLISSAGTTYLWSNGATTPFINITASDSFTVTVTNANGCQSAPSLPEIVTVNSLPPTPTITASGPINFCEGGNVTLSSSPGTAYLWSEGETTQDIIITTSGSYSVIVTNAKGCQSASSATTTVQVYALPVTPTITAGGPTTVCEGNSVTLTSSPGTTYLWSDGETNQSINVTTSGSYTVIVSNANGCLSATSVVTVVTVNPLPLTPVITAGGPTIFCIGGNVTLSSSAGTNYLWSNGETTRSINISSSGSYSVSVTNANGCQSASSIASSVTVNPLPATPVITAGGPTTFCEGGNVTLKSSSGITYLWSDGETTQDINITASGNYTVLVTNANGCQSASSISASVTVNALPNTPAIIAGGPTTFCEGGNVTLSSSSGTTYLWSDGETTKEINTTTSGSYTVKVADANGCQSTASIVTIVLVNTLPGIPTVTSNGPTTFCDGGSVSLSSSPGTTYLWSDGETTPTINITSSGSYTVIVTNANGCQSDASAAEIVTVNALPATPTITGGPLTFCSGGNVTLTSNAGSSYLWSTGETTRSITVTTSGSYSVQVSNAAGCQSASSLPAVVTVNALPGKPTITVSGPTFFCIGGSVTLTSSEGTNYKWSTGATTQSIVITETGSYSVVLTNADRCQSLQSTAVAVTVNALPETPTISASGSTTFCAGESVTLNASGGPGFSWSSGETTPDITVKASGTYLVTVTDINGCTNTAQKVITVIKTEADAGTGGDVCGQNFALNATSSTGNGTWSVTSVEGNAAFSPDVNNSTATANVSGYGIYIFTWKVINQGCQVSSDVTVVFHPVPNADAGMNQQLNYTFITDMQAGLSPSQTGTWSLLSGSGKVADIHSPVSSVSDLKIGANQFIWEVKSEGCSDSDTVSVEVYDLFVPQVITPNGDQKNDFFVIKGIENNGPAELVVIDRSGNEVYKNTNYENDWNGKSNNETELINGTYFYILKLANQKVTKGYVVIKR